MTVSLSAGLSPSGSLSPSGVAAKVGPSVVEGLEKRARLVEERQESQMFTLIVTGSSRQENADLVWSPLFWLLNKHEQMIVRHLGGPDGVDAHVAQWCRLPGQPWNAEVNSRFLVLEQVTDEAGLVGPDVSACLAFPRGRHRGHTWLCMARAWAQGMPVLCFNAELPGRFHELTEGEGLGLARQMLGWS